MKWFKHDSDAHRDAKLVKVRMKYGLEGYGLYWYLIEEIVSGVDNNNITFQLEHDAEIIAFNTGIHRERVEEMMTFMVNLALFEQSGGVITCLKLAKRLDQSMTSNSGMRGIIAQIKDSHDSIMISHDKVMQEEKRVEKTRTDIQKSSSRFAPPSLDDVRDYFVERGEAPFPARSEAEKFIDFYASKGWMVGKNKMKDWKAAIRNWMKRNNNGQGAGISNQGTGAGKPRTSVAQRATDARKEWERNNPAG